MREFLELLAVFAGIYVFDCVHWARRETVGFRATWSARTRVVAGEDMPGNERHGIVLAQPLLPFGRLFLTQIFPLSLTRDVAAAFVAQATNPGPRAAQVERAVRLEPGLAITTEARRVSVGGRLFVEAGSVRLAQRLSALLSELGSLDAQARDRRIDGLLCAALDTSAAAARVAAFERASRAVRIACTSEFALVFAVTPVVVLRFGLALAWIPLLLALAANQAVIVWTFVRAHRALFQDERAARRADAILLALSPPAAMRAVDALSRDLLAEFHPLAAASALLPRDEFALQVERTLRDALHPLPIRRGGGDPDVRAADLDWRARNLAALEVWARREGFDPVLWRGAPTRLGEDCRSYCPRCRQQFTLTEGTCARCWDLPLSPLDRQA